MEESEETIVEAREELMVSLSGGGKPTLRTAHFLLPTVTSSTGESIPKHPSHYDSSLPPKFEPKRWPLNITFNGWRSPQRKWKEWVDKMAALHEATWRRVGIYEAVMSSLYQIRRESDLLLRLAEKWCPETNTFIFPWGETTITLEDVLVAGFSVLGSPVFTSLETEEMKEAEEKLMEIRQQLNLSKARKVEHSTWIRYLMENDSEVEHEAFLSLWLARFVFPTNPLDGISKHLYPIAVCLARGIKIALGPVVLASIYRDLSLLKEKILALSKLESFEDDNENQKLELTIWSPFHIVQVWAWERFPKLQPKPNPNATDFEVLRLARWHNVSSSAPVNVRLTLDSEGSFQWRPYVTVEEGLCFKIYGDEEKWVLVDVDLDGELESFARCLRACELVGIGCVEQYCPHRVAMQFGMDQDLPGLVKRRNDTEKLAWKSFDKPIKNTLLYIPSRHLKPDVTLRYLEWWRQSVFGWKNGSGSPKSSQISVPSFERKNLDDFPLYPPGFTPKCQHVETSVPSFERKNLDDFPLYPPGFTPKRQHVEVLDSDDEDNLTLKEFSTHSKKLKIANHGIDGDGKSLPPTSHSLLSSASTCQHVEVLDSDEEDNLTLKELLTHDKKLKIANHGIDGDGKSLPPISHSLLSSAAKNSVIVTNEDAEMNLKENGFQNEPRSGKESTAMENMSTKKVDRKPSPVQDAGFLMDNGRGSGCHFDLYTDGLELEHRINKLMKEIDELKAATFG